MTLNLFKAFFFSVFGLTSNVYSAPRAEVAARLDSAIAELHKEEITKDILAIPPIASKYLKGLTDSEKIQGIYDWMNLLDAKARIHAPAAIGRLLTNDPEMISDTSELRRMLATEDEPSKFFLLSCLASYFTVRGENFIAEESRMLFRHGRVAPQTNQSTYSHVLGDVSSYTYESIVSTLSSLKAPYDETTMVPREGQIPYHEKIPILVKWLRENWPGCENLGDKITPKGESVGKPERDAASKSRPTKQTSTPAVHHGSDRGAARGLLWIAVTAGIATAAGWLGWSICSSKAKS